MKPTYTSTKPKEAAAKAGKTVFNAVTSASLNVGSKTTSQKKLKPSKKKIITSHSRIKILEGQLRTNNIEMRRVQETTDRQIKAEASKLKPITQPFSGNGKCTGKKQRNSNYGNTKIKISDNFLLERKYTTLETFTIKTRENHTKLKT
ncbi:hypothetical protein NXV09_20370 [Parabacteroides distasonis]|nr:hypothetical protein [Parabacteroides distasonis]